MSDISKKYKEQQDHYKGVRKITSNVIISDAREKSRANREHVELGPRQQLEACIIKKYLQEKENLSTEDAEKKAIKMEKKDFKKAKELIAKIIKESPESVRKAGSEFIKNNPNKEYAINWIEELSGNIKNRDDGDER